ncbi:hypothetical protein L1049_024896 [Liquidambar formosana]|uniref:B box-type domain-containing protein n=1 Tax=Liquidambar formosana TaxID=63359 RepID=A0AAP0X031_LIQFO
MGSIKTKAVGPPWLVPLSKVQFYNPCDSHPSNMVNYYCTTCKGNALCKSCHGQHEGHRIIQVFKASRYPALRIKDIDGLLDISNIQPFNINSYEIVYICSRQQKGHESQTNVINKCVVCGWELKSSKFKSCSITCDKGMVAETHGRCRLRDQPSRPSSACAGSCRVVEFTLSEAFLFHVSFLMPCWLQRSSMYLATLPRFPLPSSLFFLKYPSISSKLHRNLPGHSPATSAASL